MKGKKINLVAADMGYGHQRAAYPLLALGGGEIITVNDYKGIPEWEKAYWINMLSSYEKISRFKKIPVLGKLVFEVMDTSILPYIFIEIEKSSNKKRIFRRSSSVKGFL